MLSLAEAGGPGGGPIILLGLEAIPWTSLDLSSEAGAVNLAGVAVSLGGDFCTCSGFK